MSKGKTVFLGEVGAKKSSEDLEKGTSVKGSSVTALSLGGLGKGTKRGISGGILHLKGH